MRIDRAFDDRQAQPRREQVFQLFPDKFGVRFFVFHGFSFRSGYWGKREKSRGTISKIPGSSRNMVPLFGATRASARRGVFTDCAGAVPQALLPVQFAPLRGAVGACFSAPSSRTCGHLVVAQLAASLVRKTLELIEECFWLSFRAKRGICFFLCFCRDTRENAKLTAKARGIRSRPPAKRKRAKLWSRRSFTQNHYTRTKIFCKCYFQQP